MKTLYIVSKLCKISVTKSSVPMPKSNRVMHLESIQSRTKYPKHCWVAKVEEVF